MPLDDPRHQFGLEGEKLAEKHLVRRGMKTLARRFNTPVGELDLVMLEGPTVVFVEVKTRADRRLADPEDAVTRTKRRRLAKAMQWFLRARKLEDRPCRFDVVSIVCAEGQPPEVTHIEDAAPLE